MIAESGAVVGGGTVAAAKPKPTAARPASAELRAPPPIAFGPEAGDGLETGVVVRWNEEKGFGFLKPDGGGEDVFCHCQSIVDGASLPQNAHVRYRRKYDSRADKDRAEEVVIIAAPTEEHAEGPTGAVESADAWPAPTPQRSPAELEQVYRKRWRCGVVLTDKGRVARRY